MRQNFNISHQITNGSREFIDVMKHVQPDFCAPSPLETADLHAPPTLRPLFDLVQSTLHKTDPGDAKLVILDHIATWSGKGSRCLILAGLHVRYRMRV
jgi:hypothetical protein